MVERARMIEISLPPHIFAKSFRFSRLPKHHRTSLERRGTRRAGDRRLRRVGAVRLFTRMSALPPLSSLRLIASFCDVAATRSLSERS